MDGAEEPGAELDALARDWITLWQSELTALALEYGLLQPIRSQLERWRRAAEPWGVKR